MMEMLNVGLFEAIIVDDWKARMWAQVLPKIKVNDGAVVREGGRIGWAGLKHAYGWAGAANTVGFVDMASGLRVGLFTQFASAPQGQLTGQLDEALAKDLALPQG